jgi:very-short-patch-repair endonuclease
MIWPYILDFYCSYLLLGIEIDGSSHVWKEVYDEVRTNYLLDKWIEIIRYTNIDVYNCIEEVHQDLISRLHKKEKTKELYT